MGIAGNGAIQQLKLMANVFEVKQSHPRTAENARMGEATSCANSIWGWPAKGEESAFARLQQSCSQARTGKSAGIQRFIRNGSSSPQNAFQAMILG